MEIFQKYNGEKGIFYIELEGKTLAEMTYVWTGKDRIIIDHTEVNEKLKDRGAGKKMVSFAREKTLKYYHCALLPKVYFIK